jgi:hypothetical protein
MKKWFWLVSSVALAGRLAIGAAAENDQKKTGDPTITSPTAVAPASRFSEPADSVVVTLPGPADPPPRPVISVPSLPVTPPAVIPTLATVPAPVLIKEPARAKPVVVKREPAKSSLDAESRPNPKNIRPALPADLVKESSVFCQKQIGQWKEADARALFGAPLRQRPAYGEDQKAANGRIYAFSDPTDRYKELELDFDKSSGTLRTVFVYPPQMTWDECRRLWGNDVTSANARQGRTFYSFLNRRLDVLVDHAGKVISLGLY